MPTIEVRPRHMVNSSSTWLSQYFRNVASQCGQDGVFEKIFEIVGTRNGWSVEFGAWDGKYLSNTWNLITHKGWNGVLIEGSAEKYQELLKTHAGNTKVVSLNRYVGLEGDDTLDQLLCTTEIPEDFDLLSIDIDGNDWHVWRSLTRYRPRVVCIEFNPTVPNEVYFVQDADPSVGQGCSLLALTELAKEKGYELVAIASWDGIFVRAEDFPKFSITDNSVDAMFTPYPYLTHLFQGYDGTFWAAGNLMVQWKGIQFEADEMQIMPRAMRHHGE